MNTLTDLDIRAQVIEPALAGEYDTETVDAITDAILDAAPVDTWYLDELEYYTDTIGTEEFWAIVERVATERGAQ
ncbi:hypothetical protein G9U51_08165 [Calidifontibacter sp. DB0510]|uniref:Uncharacterized protein n=1 Tax=Metallococcus carri TaxID=1656884 RepID=A0A967B0G0_9MICO|nr:hypothetical protein [Metallococcus carri]NHN55749.1 hypothetical protein [Metallococcus carri]NOP38562.1 hypothetical protein [Calidifontibacter sp. DB2511S]